MLSKEEKRDLMKRARESFEQAHLASIQAIDASHRAAMAWQQQVELMSALGREMGSGHVNAEEITDYLMSKGRKPEAVEFLRGAIATLQADKAAEKSATEAEIASARVQTFLADELNHGILDTGNGEGTALLKRFREQDDFWRERERGRRLSSPKPEVQLALRMKLAELELDDAERL